MSHKNLKGKITISRPRGRDAESVDINVMDESSGAQFVSVRVPIAMFAEALFGLGFVECEFDLYPKNVGKIRETKHEIVPLKEYYIHDESKRRAAAAKAFAPFEVDGWKGDVSDLFNHHRRGPDGAKVLFVRYVEPAEHPATSTDGEG